MPDVEVHTADGETKMSHFPDLELHEVQIEGGPAGRNVSVKVDGTEVQKMTHVELSADVNDVIRLKTTQLVAVADLRTTIAAWEKTFTARIHIAHEGPGQEWEAIEGNGANIVEALEDAVKQVKARLS